MKKTFLLFLFSFSVFHFASAQNPLVKMWDYRFGGSGSDILCAFHKTSKGGYILGGLSDSPISGDKTQAIIGTSGYTDYWIIKIDSLGLKEWDKDYGGSDDDRLTAIEQTKDGGFIIGGSSKSSISGAKTEDTKGNFDYWIIKIDSLGNQEWDRDFGGVSEDRLYSIQQSKDGGYILGGCSISDSSGDKTQNTIGYFDYWIIKIDSLGNLEWDKDFGGLDVEWASTIQATSDGGYIIGGYSTSGISGDKSQISWGDKDYWIVKMDSLGNMQWDKDFGGSNTDILYSIIETTDGGYILEGSSYSSIGGNKSQNTWGASDFWIIKLDSTGSIQWDKDFGGFSGEDDLGVISQASNGGYLLSGTSYSPISGDKSENNLATEQTWILKTDSMGIKEWDKTIFTATPGHDEAGFAIQTMDGCYTVANYTDAPPAGYKSQPSQGGVDYWIVKFCDSTFLLPIATAFTNNLLCPGTCSDFVNSSFNATYYQWSFPGASPDTSTAINPTNICYSTPGSYDVQLIASNANGSDTLFLSDYISVYPFPPAQSITQSGDTLFAIAGSTLYQWFFNGNQINGATNYYYVAPASGNYNVVATDTNGCEVEAAILNVLANAQSPVGSWQFAVYPNPVTESLSVNGYSLSGGYFTISIYNTLGDLVIKPQTSNLKQGTSIDVSGLSPGMYWLNVLAEGKTLRAKFVKQ